jgi:probable rRNA maturation factor
VDQSFRGVVDENWLRAVVEKALCVALPGVEACQVSLAVTGDETVRSLNRDYRGLDEVTDVLSFSPSHSGHWEGETEPPEVENIETVDPGRPVFVYPPGEAAPLGEVVIAYPQSQRQALQRGVPLDQELALLIVHGVLHLAGHDHLEPLEQTEMQERERAALERLPRATIAQNRMLDK